MGVRRIDALIIALTRSHPASEQLTRLAALLRAQRRQEKVDAPSFLSRAVNITETNHGNRTATYVILPGQAKSEEAITAYQYVRKHYPSVLDILCHAAARGEIDITVEIGTLSRQDSLSYSHHDLLRIMPRVIALFRGTVRKT